MEQLKKDFEKYADRVDNWCTVFKTGIIILIITVLMQIIMVGAVFILRDKDEDSLYHAGSFREKSLDE